MSEIIKSQYALKPERGELTEIHVGPPPGMDRCTSAQMQARVARDMERYAKWQRPASLSVEIKPGLVSVETLRDFFRIVRPCPADSVRIKGWEPAYSQSASEIDRTETAAWYGRGEKPEPELSFEFELIEMRKPPKPGLLVVQGEGRYQGLGFNGDD